MTDKAQTQKEALDALPYYPTEEEAEAALRACGTSGEEIVNEFIERLLLENLRLKEELDNTRARVDGGAKGVDEVIESAISHASGLCNRGRFEDAFSVMVNALRSFGSQGSAATAPIAASVDDLCLLCGHKGVATDGTCMVPVPISSDDYHGTRRCGCKCRFRDSIATPQNEQPLEFRTTKEAMLYAQRNKIPAVIPVTSQSTAIKAAEEIAHRWFVTEDLPAKAQIQSLKLHQLRILAEHVIHKHYEAQTSKEEEKTV